MLSCHKCSLFGTS